MSSPVRLKLKRTDISIPWKDSLKGGGSQQACSAANISRIELIGPSGAWTAWATRLLKVMRESRPIDGYDGAQGQEPNTPQNDGVQGTPFAADTMRNDLAGPLGSANHGFGQALSLTPGAHRLAIYAIDPVSDVAVLIGSRTLGAFSPEGNRTSHTILNWRGPRTEPSD